MIDFYSKHLNAGISTLFVVLGITSGIWWKLSSDKWIKNELKTIEIFAHWTSECQGDDDKMSMQVLFAKSENIFKFHSNNWGCHLYWDMIPLCVYTLDMNTIWFIIQFSFLRCIKKIKTPLLLTSYVVWKEYIDLLSQTNLHYPCTRMALCVNQRTKKYSREENEIHFLCWSSSFCRFSFLHMSFAYFLLMH